MVKQFKTISLCLLGALAIVLAAGTVIEKTNGSFYYTSVPMMVLWAAIAISSMGYMIVARWWQRPATMLLHLGLLVILTGAALTRLTKSEGEMVLAANIPSNSYIDNDGTRMPLPFTVTLQQFSVVNYPATNTPANYLSRLLIDNGTCVNRLTVSINQPLTMGGYRLSQKGYTPGLEQSTLAVSHDPLGLPVTYAGYALLLVSIIVYLASPHTRLRYTIRRMRMPVVAAAIFITAPCITAQTVPHDIADRFADINVLYNGRICPAHTLAIDFTLKVCGTTTPEGLSPEQMFASWMLNPHSWNDRKIISTNRRLAKAGIGDGKHASMNDFFDAQGNYRLASSADGGSFAEKVSLVNSLTEGTLIKMFPHATDSGIRWLGFGDRLPDEVPPDEALFMRQSLSYLNSLIVAGNHEQALRVIDKIIAYQQKVCGDALPGPCKTWAEHIHNALGNTRFDAIACLLMAIVGFCCFAMRTSGRAVWMLCSLTAWAVGVHLTLLLALRWWVSGHMPLSNGYETMLFMAWCTPAVSLLLRSHILPRSIVSLPIMGMCLMVASMSRMNPQITPLVPVLQSPLLCLHVATVMLAYCLLAITLLLSVIALLLRLTRHASPYVLRHLALASQAALIVGVLVLAIGIFVGAVWANISWGRYWGWDPKEVWALITLIVYALPLHSRRFDVEANPLALNIYLTAAFVTVMVTYFGVNYLLGGLHSYA